MIRRPYRPLDYQRLSSLLLDLFDCSSWLIDGPSGQHGHILQPIAITGLIRILSSALTGPTLFFFPFISIPVESPSIRRATPRFLPRLRSPAPEMAEIEIKTAPADFRFPTTNQSRHCFTRYVEFHRCVSAKGDDTSECEKFAKYYRSLCPAEWVDKWNEQRENGTFPGPL
ncbi:hypothetical protein ACQ4PT_020178 [Festuca glaucescens]